MTSTQKADNIYLRCRICVGEITDYSQAITIFYKDFLDEKIRKYLHVNINFSDKFNKRICRECLIKLEEIHQFACLAQKNQQIFIKFASECSKTITTVSPLSPGNTLPNNTTISIVGSASATTAAATQVTASGKFMKTPLVSNEDITIFAYDELKLGQVIKDLGLLQLILRALKWDDSRKNLTDQLEKLKNTGFHQVLSNPDLLGDTDLVQLLGPYVKQDKIKKIPITTSTPPPHQSIDNQNADNIETNSNSGHNLNGFDAAIDENSNNVMEMEVGVDPDLFFPYDDDETRSAEEVAELNSCEDVKPLLCPTCPDLFTSESDLKDHILKHMLEKHEAEEDQEEKEMLSDYNVEVVVREKKRRKKPTSSRFTCSVCKKKLSTKGNLKVHLETHRPKGKFSCEKCGRIFKTYLNLARHKKYHVNDKYECPTCARVYPTSSTLKAHIVSHSSIRPHNCPICFKTFKRGQDLKFHINQHTGDKPYKCAFCPKTFASSGNCFSHRKRMHSHELAIALDNDN